MLYKPTNIKETLKMFKRKEFRNRNSKLNPYKWYDSFAISEKDI